MEEQDNTISTLTESHEIENNVEILEIETPPTPINIKKIAFGYDENEKRDSDRRKYLTYSEFKKYQLTKSKNITWNDEDSSDQQVALDYVLLKNNECSLICFYQPYGGEAHTYLISYDSAGNLVDECRISYDDFVEYFFDRKSIIEGNTVTIYDLSYGMEDESKHDTIVYKITPSLRFELISTTEQEE